MAEKANDIAIKFSRGGGLLIGKSDASTGDGVKIPQTATAQGAGFGDVVNDEDRKFASEREPIAILLTYGLAGDVTEKWFRIDDPDTEEADPALDRLVQDALSTLKFRTKLKQLLTQKLIYKWSLLVGAFTDTKRPEDLKNPLRQGSELKQLQVYNKTNVRIVEKDLDQMSPRYGKPVIYELNRGNGILTQVHFTRCSKFPDEECDEQSILDGVWDDLTCGRNIRWGVSQYMYRTGHAFPVIGFPAGTTLTQLEAYEGSGAFRDLMSRTHIAIAQNDTTANTGMTFEFKGAAGATLDPTPFFKTNDEQISKATGIPQPSLVGAQAGAVTGSEVNMQGKYKVVSRYQAELEDVIRWVIDRLAESGQIGLVASSTATDEAKKRFGKLKAMFDRVFSKDYRHKTAKTYVIEWNSAFELSELDEARLHDTEAACNQKKLDWMSIDEVRADEGLDPLPDGEGEWKAKSTGLQLFSNQQTPNDPNTPKQDPNNPENKGKMPNEQQQQMNQADKFLVIDLNKPVRRRVSPMPHSYDAGEEGSWVTINGVHILLKDGETTAQAFERTTGKKLEGGKGKTINTPSNQVGSGEKMQPITNTIKGKTITYQVELSGESKINVDNDKLLEVKKLTLNSGETLSKSDIINVAKDPDDWTQGNAEQYKIKEMNLLKFQGDPIKSPYASGLKRDNQVLISGETARGSTTVLPPEKFWRISKQNFSK